MKVLILGGSGMLGHKVWQVLAPQFETFVTLLEGFADYADCGVFDPARTRGNVSVEDLDSVERAISELQPEVVVNCIGIVKQTKAAQDPLTSISVNSLFPHQLARICHKRHSRLIHISTDCVFSGRRGNYVEGDVADAEDLYGRSKYLGEVSGDGCMTIRTSMVGRELRTTNGLIEWFLSEEGKTVAGYKRAIFSGLTTLALARLIALIIRDHGDMNGLWHVASSPISKYDLLCLIREVYGVDIQIVPDELTGVVDRSLNGNRFREKTGCTVPSWKEMIVDLHQDPTPYSEIRRAHAEG